MVRTEPRSVTMSRQLDSGQSRECVEQPIQVVLGVVQMKADADRSRAHGGPDTGAPQPVGRVGDGYRYDRRILLR